MAKETVKLTLNLNKAASDIMRKLSSHEGHVGVLAASVNEGREEGDPLNNAELAAVHEFGTLAGNIPARSFFKTTEKYKSEEMSKWIVGEKDRILKRIMNGQTELVIRKMCIKWQEFIHKCFETEGFGTWKSLSKATLIARNKKRKKKKQGGAKILQDSGAMERSITYEVVKCSRK